MTSRERVRAALNFQEPDRVPLDLGGTRMSGIHGESYARLKRALGISGGSVRLYDVYQLICDVELPVAEALGVDVLPVNPLRCAFGLRNDVYRPYHFWWTPEWSTTEVPCGFKPTIEPDGSLTLVDGDPGRSGGIGRMPERGWYFDRVESTALSDSPELVDISDFRAQLRRLSDADLDYARTQSEALHRETDKALVGGEGLANLSGPPSMPFADWMVVHLTEKEYVHELFDVRIEVAIENARAYRDAVGDRIEAVLVSGVDYGMQTGEMFSPEVFRELYAPHMKRINDWIHENTNWKTFYHSDGGMRRIIGPMIEAGMDILQPVQLDAANMDAAELKQEFGDRLVFWGAGPNPQETLPFGAPDEVRREVRERVKALAPGGGSVFGGIHNIQAQVPTENMLALFEEFDAVRDYPVRS